MAVGPILMSLFTLALLLPALYKRHLRRSGALTTRTAAQNRKGRMAVAGISALLVVGTMAGGAAYASNGDANGGATGTDVTNLVPAGSDHTSPTLDDVAAAAEKDRVSINMVWLMVGGILVLFMQAGFALVETGFTRAKNASHTMMMNLVIFALGVVGWFTCGYALMFGATDQHAI